MPEFTMTSTDQRVQLQGTVTYRCAGCGEKIPDHEVLFVDEPSGFVGTRIPTPLPKTLRTYHLSHPPIQP